MREVINGRDVQLVVTPGAGEKLFGQLHYSQAARFGNRVEISGQGGWDDDLNVPASLEEEIVTAFDNVERTLAAVGATWRDVVHVNSYHVIIPPDGTFQAHNVVMADQYRKRMGDRAPVWTQIGVTALGLPEMRVEIRATAILEG